MANEYTFTEFLKTVYSFIITRIFYSPALLIRRPVYLRGRSSLVMKKGLTTGYSCRFDLPGKNKKTLFIGDNCKIGDNVHIVAHEKVIIGNNVLMASKIFISDTSHGAYKGMNMSSPTTPPNDRPLHTSPVIIGNNVWIGENVCILPGVTIGDGCVIGANAVVTKSFNDNTIIVGVPATRINRY